jgi:pimeloyl-ACP methyl ester carboxylesterase
MSGDAAIRKYGRPPHRVTVLHGGPGARGSVAPLARELSVDMGVLEPLQSADSVDGQVLELKAQLEDAAELPVVLVGSSWGAMLGCILSARYPKLVRKLIMVGSGPLEARYAESIEPTRLSRLTEPQKLRLSCILQRFEDESVQEKDELMAEFGALFSNTDTYDPLPSDGNVVDCRYDILTKVWTEAAEMRKSGALLELAGSIACPVVAIHGDYDPHPADGVREPLSRVLRDFRFILLEKCGHEPWIEKHARDRFFEILREEFI